MNLLYEINGPLEAAEMAQVFRRAGLRRPVDDAARMERMLAHANLTVTARAEDGRLLGLARALTDFSYCCYVSDLAVDTEFQKRGIGREIMQRLAEHLGPEVMILLLAGPKALEYYPKIGFEKSDTAWMIPRKK